MEGSQGHRAGSGGSGTGTGRGGLWPAGFTHGIVCWLCLGEARLRAIFPLLLSGKSRFLCLGTDFGGFASGQSLSFGDLSAAVCH